MRCTASWYHVQMCKKQKRIAYQETCLGITTRRLNMSILVSGNQLINHIDQDKNLSSFKWLRKKELYKLILRKVKELY